MERAGYPPMQPLPPEAYDRDMAVVDRAIVFGIRGAATGVVCHDKYGATHTNFRGPAENVPDSTGKCE